MAAIFTLLNGLRSCVSRLAGRYSIAYAILYGSAARGCLRRDSDVDVAVRSLRELGLWDVVDIALRLSDAVGLRVDVRTLSPGEDPVFAFEVFSTGRPIWIGDRGVYLRDYFKACKLYWDFKPLLERSFKRAVEWIRREAGAGEEG